MENLIKNYFENISGVTAIFLFGSEAKGRGTVRSDVDLAALFHPNSIPDSLRQLDLREDLISLLGKEVDLVVLNRANPILCKRVLEEGKGLLIKNKSRLGDFISRTLTDYEDLKRLRAPIEKAILKGRIYVE